jgi:hypothetical protein
MRLWSFSDIGVFNIAYGGCWEPAMAQYNLCMNLINQPSADPSRPLPIWDKLRVLLHGRLTMCVDKMSWIYPASLDPYNKTEMMDWTWSKLILDWTNGMGLLGCNGIKLCEMSTSFRISLGLLAA